MEIAAAECHLSADNAWLRRARVAKRMLDLQWQNASATTPVAGGTGPDVSLTSYGKRLQTVHLTLESIGAGSLLPRRLILWLDDRGAARHPPPALRRLQARGLEIRQVEDLGPHKKYFPYLLEVPLTGAMVTADDDVFYPRNWLSGLHTRYLEQPGCVHAYRAHIAAIDRNTNSFKPYGLWEPCRTKAPNRLHFSTGCSGVLFPVPVLEALRRGGRGFLDCCPRADDVWLNLHAVRTGFPVAQVHEESLRFVGPLLTQGKGLFHQNLFSGGNDRALAATFNDTDMELLLAVS